MPASPAVPLSSVSSYGGMVASADHLATSAGVGILALGGTAADAAIATNAAIAVTEPSLCGMGGDLFALVHDQGAVHALNASGRAGSGADPAALRARGLTTIPLRLDVQAVTVPGCVSGWVALHERFGTLPLTTLLAPAIRLAEHGFPASPLLVRSLAAVGADGKANLHELASQATAVGDRVRRPGVARTLRAIAGGGAAAFYDGEFGRGLLELGRGLFAPDDLSTAAADWVRPLHTDVWGHTLWGLPPNSQTYLLLGAARVAERVGLPVDAEDPGWAHVLIEAAIAAGRDRPARLHDEADGEALVEEVAGRTDEVNLSHASDRRAPAQPGDTTYLCTIDDAGMAVSLIQSNASGFGSWLVEPATGINLHDRGVGFNLEAGHRAELQPGRRPPHTLCAAMATADDRLAALFGTMGGDAQPQILLQLAARILAGGESPAAAVRAARWVLHPDAATSNGFDTWTSTDGRIVAVEDHAPDGWITGLEERGHRVSVQRALDGGFGHAHAITIGAEGLRRAAADPRTFVGSAAAH